MTDKDQIAFLYTSMRPFIKKDLEIYQQEYRVHAHEFDAKHKALIFLSFIQQLYFLLRYAWSCKLFVVYFAGYHGVLPGIFAKVLRKPVVIISAGTDAVSFPSFGYGNFSKKVMGAFTAWSFRLCTHIAPVHDSLMYREASYYQDDLPKQGIFHFVKGLKKPFTMVPYGFDDQKWFPHSDAPKIPNSFITVGYIADQKRFKLKGIDLIYEIAPHFPECKFTVAGMNYEPAIPKPDNLEVLPPLPNSELINLYQKHEYYFQLSISEGHPNAICEAMLCNCIPIGSQVTAIPDIVADTGFILPKRDPSLLRSLVADALQVDRSKQGAKARTHIQQNYSYQRRSEGLLSIAKKLLSKA